MASITRNVFKGQTKSDCYEQFNDFVQGLSEPFRTILSAQVISCVEIIPKLMTPAALETWADGMSDELYAELIRGEQPYWLLETVVLTQLNKDHERQQENPQETITERPIHVDA